MPNRRSYGAYSSYYGREKQRRIPSPLPYLLVALLAGAGLGYFHFFAFHSLDGKVLNAYTGSPMPDVAVVVRSDPSLYNTPQAAAKTVVTATTGVDGAFRFDKLPPNPVA